MAPRDVGVKPLNSSDTSFARESKKQCTEKSGFPLHGYIPSSPAGNPDANCVLSLESVSFLLNGDVGVKGDAEGSYLRLVDFGITQL